MTNDINNAPAVPASAESLRYLVKNLDLGKETLKQALWDAADQLERMSSQFTEVMTYAQQMQEQAQEFQAERERTHELIAQLQAENSRLQMGAMQEDHQQEYREPESAPLENLEWEPDGEPMSAPEPEGEPIAEPDTTEVRTFIEQKMAELDALDIDEDEKQRRMNEAIQENYGGEA